VLKPSESRKECAVDVVKSCMTVIEYSPSLPPPTDWLRMRHRDIPCIFRDTFTTTAFWTAQQQTAIISTFKDWNSDENHPLLDRLGSILKADTRTSANVLTPAYQQNHSLRYYSDQLQRRGTRTRGHIIYSIDVKEYYKVQSFRHGPSSLSFYCHDVHYHMDPAATELTLIAGMKNCWTPPHVDPGGDSTWQCLLEGRKMWIFARPEQTQLMMSYFPQDKGVQWCQWTTADRHFLTSNRLLMVIQSAGDIIYVPHGWPHMVKHLTDTFAINSTVLNGWSIARALGSLSFSKDMMSDADRDMYAAIVQYVWTANNSAKVGLSSDELIEIIDVYAKKNRESIPAEEIAEHPAQAEQQVPGRASTKRKRKQP
jgi:hypothetical protein